MDEDTRNFIRDMAEPLGNIHAVRQEMEALHARVNAHSIQIDEHEKRLVEMDKQLAINSLVLNIIRWLGMSIVGSAIVVLVTQMLGGS